MAIEMTLMSAEPLPEDWDWSIRLMVWGSAPYPRSLPFEARVGDQVVAGISVSPDGSGFTGYLKTPPAPGDTLTIILPGQEPVDTGLTITDQPNS